MKSPGFLLVSLALLGRAIAEDAAKIDPAQRNSPFTPAATVTPDKSKPEVDTAVQSKRFEAPTVERKESVLTGQRAAITVGEDRQKNIQEKKSTRPEAPAPELSGFNHRESRISTSDAYEKPPVVSRYQDSLVSASATNMARFPAAEAGVKAKINRFVFRKNNPDPASPTVAATPAASATPK